MNSLLVKMKKKRTRVNEVKKWNDKEIVDILTFMQAHRNVEKPTAQIYYRKLLAETKIVASWSMVRFKVRHLKTLLQKAEELKCSTSVSLKDGHHEKTVDEKILKMCPHYGQLSDIFPGSREIKSVVRETMPIEDDSSSAIDMAFNDSVDSMDSAVSTSLSAKLRKSAEKPALSTPMSMETERTEMQRDLEIEKFLWAKQLEADKMRLEEMRIRIEDKRREDEFQLKKLELEQRERIKRLELELKYGRKN
ncbi:maker765 [Drosophila busckii]|uniref:Maker765 n=1 Tax=Drosophila busckii TaxID=30019 RepID=A0A0M5JBL1_DROBS|nr:uncharacterized protein LOC108598262 [Drosophila busckii]ALC44856.1 maker765 [Drosophila busckii]